MGRLKNKDIGKIIAKINTIPNAAIYIHLQQQLV